MPFGVLWGAKLFLSIFTFPNIMMKEDSNDLASNDAYIFSYALLLTDS